MRIPTSNYLNPSQNQTETNSVKAASQAAKAYSTGSITSSNSSGDQVQISGLSQLLQAGAQSRAEKITSLTSQFRSGTYSVGAGQVSGALVSETLARSGRG